MLVPFLCTLTSVGPNEQRTISREDLGFYHNLIVGAVYETEDNIDCSVHESFYYPLKCCIEEHPYLSVVVGDMHTDNAFFQRVPIINLKEHVFILDRHIAGDAQSRIEDILAANLDVPLSRVIPPWKIIILPFQHGCFIAFCFSHTIGDALTGKAFHGTLLNALRHGTKAAHLRLRTIDTPERALPAPFDTAERLPISWPFLLSPLLSLFVPKFISVLFGLRTSASVANAGTWTGSRIPQNPNKSHSKIVLREIGTTLLERTLSAARTHEAKLTGLFEEILTRALSKSIPGNGVTNFVSQTAINMRRCIGISEDEGGEFVSGCYIVHPRQDHYALFCEENFVAAKSYSRRLAETASTLQDQPVGLLRYLPSMRNWTLSKLGQQRDCSFEVSNIGTFDNNNDAPYNHAKAKITRMVFAQPGHVLSAPLAFNLVSVKGAALMYTVSWQAGALNIGEDNEESVVDEICSSIERDFAELQ